MIVDGMQGGRIGVAGEELGPGREHDKGFPPPPGFAEHGGTEQIVAQAEGAKDERALWRSPSRQAANQPRRQCQAMQKAVSR
jgi:hypothetical protein